VLHTALDAIEAGFEVLLVPDATRAVEVAPGDGERAIARMLARGAVPVRLSGDILVADVQLGALP
jgi:nicotinamidase/pyrazinamidase